jgi:hypothetical protein
LTPGQGCEVKIVFEFLSRNCQVKCMAIEVQIVFDRENKNAINLPTAKARNLQFGRVVKKFFFLLLTLI